MYLQPWCNQRRKDKPPALPRCRSSAGTPRSRCSRSLPCMSQLHMGCKHPQARCIPQDIPVSSHPLHRSRPKMTCPSDIPHKLSPKWLLPGSSICLSRTPRSHTRWDCPPWSSTSLPHNQCMFLSTQPQQPANTCRLRTIRSLSPRRCPASQDTCPPRSLGNYLDEMRPQPRCICLPRT